MKINLKGLSPEMRELLCLSGDIARKNKMRVYLAGGFVRDLLLGVNNFDLDIAVEGDGIKFSEELSRLICARLIRHKRFGTATLVSPGHLKIDVTTARKETYPQPGSLPEVSPGILRDDLARRDFTINAMAVSIMAEDFGELVDLFGGRADLLSKKVRILHDLSFIDDPTRMLRAIRFEQRYGFRIEPHTLRLLKEAAGLKVLEGVQPQRLRDELILDLKEPSPLKVARRINSLAAWRFIHRELKPGRQAFSLFSAVKAQTAWYARSFPRRRQLDNWLLYLIALLDPLSPAQAEKVCRDFAFHRGESKRIISFKKLSKTFIARLGSAGILPSKVYEMLEPLSYETIIMLKSKYKNPALHRQIDNFFRLYNGVRPHLSGDDLLSLGIRPGKHYQGILKKLLSGRLNGKVSTREEELRMARKIKAAGI